MATVVRGPDRTFGSNATIDLGDRVVTMAYAGRGHTDGDVAVLVPDTDVMFLGDLVEESAHPSFGHDCSPLEWADALTSHLVQVAERTVVVPGHGHPVDGAFVTRQRDEIAAVAAVIRERRLGAASSTRRCATRTRACPTRSTTSSPRSAAAGTTSPRPPPDPQARPLPLRRPPASGGSPAPGAGDPPHSGTALTTSPTAQRGEHAVAAPVHPRLLSRRTTAAAVRQGSATWTQPRRTVTPRPRRTRCLARGRAIPRPPSLNESPSSSMTAMRGVLDVAVRASRRVRSLR